MKRIKSIIILLSVLCVLLLLCGCKGNTEDESSSVEQQAEEGIESLYGDKSLGIDAAVDQDLRDYRLIAVLGLDDGGHNDINMIISFNKTDGTAKIVSIIRDSYMQVKEATDEEPAEYNRCNVGYERDGKYGAMKILNRNLDLNIRECICMDWECVADLINALGGLTVDIDEGMLDALNEMLPEDNQILQSGTQTINGWQAVQYMRARKYIGGDTIKRANNSQDVFLQLYDQAKAMSASEIAEVYDQIADELDTNMSRSNLTDTLAQIATVDIEETETWPYKWVRMKDSKNDYRTPDSLISNVKELHKVLFGQEDYLTSITVQEIHDGMLEAEKNLREIG